jgi:hypothetical protein
MSGEGVLLELLADGVDDVDFRGAGVQGPGSGAGVVAVVCWSCWWRAW